MNTVQPIRDPAVIQEMKEYLKNSSSKNPKICLRNYFLFTFGINVGLRISDIITLKASDVTGSHVSLVERKTGKNRRYKLNSMLKKEIADYCKQAGKESYLFPSQKGGHITRVQAYNIINNAAKHVGLEFEVGTHTLRKTFGYWHYKQYKDVAALQILFNHASASDTLRYIGIEQDQLDELADKFFI
ncbi:MAG: site-specific integrase [Eubacteriaceae bacterium]|nr:site-specific integrase [Eubacteriaceae bacterium]